MSKSRFPYLVLVLGFATLFACGEGNPSPSADAALSDAALNDASPYDATPPPCPDDIGGSIGMACTLEGQACGGPCDDACSFCNIITCSQGMWEPVEVFPVPCFDCGDSLRCEEDSEYCHVRHPDVSGTPDTFECLRMPDACATDVTCTCLEAEADLAFDQCTESAEGNLTVESSGG